MLKVTVFDVERGLAVFVRSPTGLGMLIDCGCSTTFSPAKWIAANEAPTLTKWNGYSLTQLVVTHPHDDHVEDIANLKALLCPGSIHRENRFDWPAIVAPADGEPSENVVTYYEWQKTYNAPIVIPPNWGMSVQHFGITPAKAATISSATQNLLNNASLVTVLTYTTPTGGSWKVVVAGDNETAGWTELLKDASFKGAISGADFFITSHHGHESGFSPDLFAAMGTPILNITSEKAGDECVFDYGPYAQGRQIKGEQRKHLTTRCDGHISLSLYPDLSWNCSTSR